MIEAKIKSKENSAHLSCRIFISSLLLFASALLQAQVTQLESEKNEESWTNYQTNDEQNIEDIEKKNLAKNLTGGILIEEIIEPSEGYNYAVFNRSDPFVPPYLKQRSLEDAEEPIVSVLQLHDLASLTVNGVWRSQQGDPKALIMTKNKEGVIVSLNDPVGNKNGKVVAIADQAVTIRQFSYSGDGSRQFEDFELALQTVSYDLQGAQKLQLDSLNKIEDIESQMREQTSAKLDTVPVPDSATIGPTGDLSGDASANTSQSEIKPKTDSKNQNIETMIEQNFQP
ncbi:MAG: pilus assembly protein PilP [Oligoflexales bacterium]|nr:pilus assembly protein PilP [Oligoflexales bacterium]